MRGYFVPRGKFGGSSRAGAPHATFHWASQHRAVRAGAANQSALRAPRRASGALHVQLVRLGRVLHDELEPGRAVAPHQFGDRLLRHHPLGVGNADFKQATPLGRKGRFV